MSPTDTVEELVTEFLERFNSSRDAGGEEVAAGCFSETFLMGDAAGVRPVPRTAFLQALPRRRAMFDQAGAGTVSLDGYSYEQLDEHYVLLRASWTASKDDGGTLELSSSFLLYRGEGAFRAVAYLNHRGL